MQATRTLRTAATAPRAGAADRRFAAVDLDTPADHAAGDDDAAGDLVPEHDRPTRRPTTTTGGTTDDEDTDEPTTTTLTGTVVHLNPEAASYTIADRRPAADRDPLATARPTVGKAVEVEARQLANGTYVETGNRDENGKRRPGLVRRHGQLQQIP